MSTRNDLKLVSSAIASKITIGLSANTAILPEATESRQKLFGRSQKPRLNFGRRHSWLRERRSLKIKLNPSRSLSRYMRQAI
jgi:hypothetical protein